MLCLRKNSLLILFFCFGLYALAQDKKDSVTYNLSSLLKMARENNADLQLQKLNLQKARQDIKERTASFLPRLDAYADYRLYWDDVPQYIFPEKEGQILSGGQSNGIYPVSIGLPNNLYAGLSLSQRLFDYSFFSAGKGNDLMNEVEVSQRKESAEKVYYDIVQCYFEITQLAAKEDFIDYNLEQIDQFVEVVQVQLNNQMTDSLQLFELELSKEELALNKRELLSGLKRKSNYLKMLVGLPDSVSVKFDMLDYSPILKPDLMAESDIENPQLSLLNQAKQLNELNQKQIQAEYLPTLDLKLNLLWNAQADNLVFAGDNSFGNNISTLGLKLDIPIYHGNEKKSKLRKLKLDKQILDVQKDKLVNGYELQLNNSVDNLSFKTERYLHQQKITQLKKRYFQKLNNQFEQGILPL